MSSIRLSSKHNGFFRGKFLLQALVVLVVAIPRHSGAQDELLCGEMHPNMNYQGGHYGPYDYANPEHRANNLRVVENHHFTETVRSMRGGNTSSTAGGDLAYTLLAFPNHHQALNVLIRLSIKERRDKPEGMEYTVECWFSRAIRWRPSDPVSHVIYGNYLFRKRRLDDAIAQYRTAEELGLNDANLYYAMGLALFDKKDLSGSLVYAGKAYGMGYQLPGLRHKLIDAGVWKEP